MKSAAFGTTRRKPASDRYRGGLNLYLRGECVGSIARDKVTGKYVVCVVNAKDAPFMEEFDTFHDADISAWVHATS